MIKKYFIIRISHELIEQLKWYRMNRETTIDFYLCPISIAIIRRVEKEFCLFSTNKDILLTQQKYIYQNKEININVLLQSNL